MDEEALQEWVYNVQMRLKKVIDIELHQAAIISIFDREIDKGAGSNIPPNMDPRFIQ